MSLRVEKAASPSLNAVEVPEGTKTRASPPRSTGVVVAIGIGMIAAAILVAEILFSIPTTSLLTSADGASLAQDAQSAMLVSFAVLGSAIGLSFLARREIDDTGWALAAPISGGVIGFLLLGVLEEGARALATAPVFNGRAQVDPGPATASALLAVAMIGALVVTLVRGWRPGGAAAWSASALLSAIGVAGLLFSMWVLSNAETLHAEAAARSHNYSPSPAVAMVVAVVLAAGALRRRRG